MYNYKENIFFMYYETIYQAKIKLFEVCNWLFKIL